MTARSDIAFRFLLAALYLIAAAVIVSCLVDGFDYYATPIADRPQHEQYRQLRPAGVSGHGLGIVGSALLLLLLLYSVRKRTRRWEKLGTPSQWLQVHICFGIVGPLLIILHTSFKVQGLVAVSFWSMIAVGLSGVFGRYLYLQIPRNLIGAALSLQEIEALDRELTARLVHEHECGEKEIERIQNTAIIGYPEARIGAAVGRWRAIGLQIASDLTLNWRLRRLRGEIAAPGSLSPARLRALMRLARRKALLQRRLGLLQGMRELFHYWHVVHKPFAVIMLAIMVVHILVTVLLGYTWVF